VDMHTNRLRTKFFNAEGFSLTQFHKHLRSVYGEDIKDVSSVIHWIHWSNSSEKTLVTGPHSASAEFYKTGIQHLMQRWNVY